MDKSTLSNYGWIVIAVLVLAVMIALATPFGTYIKSGVESTTQGLFDTSEKAMNVVGMSASNSTNSENDISINTGVVPDGATYTVKSTGQVLDSGDELPTTLSAGDVLEYKNVFYTIKKSNKTYSSLQELEQARQEYKQQLMTNFNTDSWDVVLEYAAAEGLTEDDLWEMTGLTEDNVATTTWSARADYTVYKTAKLAASAPVSNTVLGYSVTNNIATLDAVNGTVPDGATYTVKSTGQVLNTGDTLPDICAYNDTITYGDYTYIYKTISGGWSTDGWTVSINTDVTDENQTSYGAILSEIIGEKVTSLCQTFDNCKSLTTAPVIPNTITDMLGSFTHCTSLTIAPTIPESVTNMDNTFYDCTSLTTASNIPSGVTTMNLLYGDCYSLAGTITIDANPQSYFNFLQSVDVSKITLTGSSNMLPTLAQKTGGDNIDQITIIQ